MDLSAKKIHVISLGCPRNLVDSEVMLGMALQEGCEVTPELEKADYIVINTCGFLQIARDESLAIIGSVFERRKKGAKVIVAGCMVQTYAAEIKKIFPNVDYFLGTGDVEGIIRALRLRERGGEVSSVRSYLETGEMVRTLSTPDHYAYLKIAEGCRKKCSYCMIPTIKGPLKSKPIEQVVKEFRSLRERGVKEILLIAQDLGDWGKDMGPLRLIDLLQELLKEKGGFWLRLLYLYPDEISLPLIRLMKSDPRICPYLDIPIQHINDTILKAMHRATSKEEIIHVITLLRMEIPAISLRTSLIVGFPGETEKQFEELTSFVQEYPFDQVGIFRYSREAGSPAASLLRQIPEKIKKKREMRLARIQQKVLKKNLKRMLGKTVRVIVEGYHPDSPFLMKGRHSGQCPEIDSEVIINDGRKVDRFGSWYDVKITDVSGYDLVGAVV